MAAPSTRQSPRTHVGPYGGHSGAGSNPSVGTENRTEPPKSSPGSSLEPYISRLERFELFSTNQCYYIVGSNKLNTAYRIIKIDRTLIERPNNNNSSASSGQQRQHTMNAPNRSYGSSQFSPRRPYPSNGNDPTAMNTPHAPPKAAPAPPAPPSNPSNPPTTNAAEQDGQHTANPKSRPLSDFVSEDPNVYSQEEIKEMLDMIHDGNRMTRNAHHSAHNQRHQQGGGGLKPIVKAYGIVGFIRFLDCYYLTLITKRAKVGSIGGNGIYTIKNTETIPLKPAEKMSDAEDLDPSSVLLSMWNRGKRSVGLGLSNREIAELRYQGIYQVLDLSKSFFFSYTYDMTRTLQENFLATTCRPFPPPPFKDLYAWNFFLTREFEGCLNSDSSYNWVLPIVHGAFLQRKVQDYGRSLDIFLIARRSRHFAGTRYLKRGVSDQGKVANDVEHEQILEDNESATGANGESGASTFSSYIQVRGSIPNYWHQESSVTMPKPPIELNRVDPTYKATQLHFEDLFERYATPVLVLDLVKQSEKRAREVLVGNEYRHALDYINNSIDKEKHKILYCSFDYSHTSKHRQLDVSSSLSEVSTWAVNSTGFFCSNPKWKMKRGGVLEPFTKEDQLLPQLLRDSLGIPVFPMEQSGVLRTNCIDCLDRTNVAQFSAGVEAMTQQLVVMGIRSQSKLDPSSNIVRALIDMYVDIGDSVALQYGGSEAHKKVSDAADSYMPIGKHKELLTSIRRYYSNAFTDRLKQDAINLFLGYYVPYMHTEPLWEMESDYYLHNFHVKESQGLTDSMDFYRHAFGIQPYKSEIVGKPARATRSTSVDTIATSKKPPGILSTGESNRVGNVRKRVAAQNKALSGWWKRALHRTLQQRVWMKEASIMSGGNGMGYDTEDLPSRYERLYQPEKIAQFDRFFARNWAQPSRTAPDRVNEPEPSGGVTFSRVVTKECSACLTDKRDDSSEISKQSTKGEPIRRFLEVSGYDAPFESSSNLFVEHVEREGDSAPYSSSGPEFVGDVHSSEAVPDIYRRYCAPSSSIFSSPFSANELSKKEFNTNLREMSLQSDDVDGIRELSESAHLNSTILSGPYKGLSSSESAVEFAIAVEEQFNPMESATSRTRQQIETELNRRGFSAAGVQDSIDQRWGSFYKSEQQFSEMLSKPTTSCRRSDLTTTESLKQYVSLCDNASLLSTSDIIFLTGEKTKRTGPPVLGQPPAQSVSFTKRASRLGINIGSHPEGTNNKGSSLFLSHRRKSIPTGFEQINDDLFARKDNKFMVFNGAACDTFGFEPVTRIMQPSDLFLMDDE